MPQLIEVCFKGNRKEFFLWEGDEPPPMRAPVIVDADRGEDLGHVHAVGERAIDRARGCAHGPGENPVALVARRLASPEELRRVRELREQDESARQKATEKVRAHGLAMKLSDAEWRWDRRKLTLYFTAEKRVDFRNLVRELATMFRTRIELKQIGVRDEARRLSGIGRCGREYCSAAWLQELRPVNLGVAKDQRLSLNPGQISGACGRLMCCLRYEHDFYVQQRKRFPKEGKVITTARGLEKVVSNDIFRERVTLRSEDGETHIVALAELRAGTDGERPTEVATDEESSTSLLEGIPEEVIRLQDTVELPAWTPREKAGNNPGGRRLPLASATSAPERAVPAAAMRPRRNDAPPRSKAEPGASRAKPTTPAGGPSEPVVDARAIGDSTPAAPSTPDRNERRKRRRGRRGGRRNRDGGGESGDGKAGGGDGEKGGGDNS